MATPAPTDSTSRPTRFAEFIGSAPLVTLFLLAVNIGVYIFCLIGDYGEIVAAAAIRPYSVLKQYEVYRVVTAAFVHGGLMHIGMNMLSLFQLGSGLEAMFGSLQFLFVIGLFTVLVGSLYVFLGWFLSVVYDPVYLFSSAVGFSGVLFAMAVDEASLSPFPTRSIFGLFSVPTKLYPWVLMFILQFLLPNVSFLGHLAGVIVGLLHTWGAFNFMVPSLGKCKKLQEARWFAASVGRWRSYRPVPDTDPALRREGNSVRAYCGTIAAYLGYVCRPCIDVFAGLRRRRERDSAPPGQFSSSGSTGGAAVGAQAVSPSLPMPSAPVAGTSSGRSMADVEAGLSSGPTSGSGAAARPSQSQESSATATAATAAARAALAAAARARAARAAGTAGSPPTAPAADTAAPAAVSVEKKTPAATKPNAGAETDREKEKRAEDEDESEGAPLMKGGSR